MAFDAATTAASTLIHSYTGLSPAEFFTIASLMVGVFFLVSRGFFVSPKETQSRSIPPPEFFTPPPSPVQLGDMTLEELRSYDGSQADKPLLVAIKGQVYDVSAGSSSLLMRRVLSMSSFFQHFLQLLFYGPGGAYSFFAGRETSRALALMSFDPSDFNDNLEDLNSAELEVLQDWEEKFKEKYVKVGQIVSSNVEVGDDNENSGASGN